MKKSRITISLVLVIVLIAGGYILNMFGLLNSGNYGKYSVKNTAVVENSPIKGKTVVFLGSSVTYGYSSMGVSFVDYLGKSDGITPIKKAVSGTTLVDVKNNSYVSRIKNINKNIEVDAFVCQLSTNDATKEMPLGEVSEGYNINSFDTQTIAGAIEYIIGYASENWNCPVIFYTQAKYDSEYYGKMVDLLLVIQKKWDITVIDLWNDVDFNNITEQQRKLYLVDPIHPTKAGYHDWWLPVFQECLYDVIG